MKKKMRLFSLLLLIPLLLCLLPGALADEDGCSGSEDGQHNWVVYEIPPTCTDPGSREYQCTKCYDSRDYETLPALGHDWGEWSTRREATCTEGGTEYHQCSRCNIGESRETAALGHIWDSGSVTTAATCSSEGVRTFTCTRCGATKTESIPLTDHTPVTVPAAAATCTSGGKTEGSKCSVCGTILTAQQDIPALGHTAVSIPGKAATCTESGLTEGSKCSVCGTVLTAQQTIPALGHTAVSIPGKAATCTESGLTEGSKCSVCGTVLTAQQTIAALGHTAVSIPGKAATCTESGLTEGSKCSVCGTILTAQQDIPALGHTAVSIPGKAATCTESGLTEGSQCSVCGTVLTTQQDIPAPGHDWDAGVTEEPGSLNPGVTIYTCARCGKTRAEEIPATGFSINLMRNYPPIPEGAQGLRIVQQPVGGILADGGTVRLTVEVEGGVGDYTYEWHCENDSFLQAKDTLYQQAGTFAEAAVSSYNNNKSGFAGDFAKAVQKTSHVIGTLDTSGAYAFGGALYEASQAPASYDLNDHLMGSSTGSVYTAVSPGSYYCVISDEAGNFVCSEDAMVTTALFISVQPVSRNIYGRDAVNLTCVAGGGSGPENLYYNWYDAEGNLLGDESTYKADQEGEYYCRVGDFKTDEVVDSDLVQVYSQEIDLRPVITLQPESVQLEYREDGRYDWDMMCLALTFDGGSEDLKYQWQMYSKAFGFGLWRSIGEGQIIRRPDESGTFRCKVIDTRSGAYTYSDIATVDLGFTCIITGIESTNGYWFTMGYTIMGGNGPFTVKVYQHRYVGYNYTKGEANYMEVLMWTKTIQEAGHYRTPSVECAYSMCHQYSQNEEPSITIYHPDYYLFVEDASGHQFTTDLFEQYKANNT